MVRREKRRERVRKRVRTVERERSGGVQYTLVRERER